MKFLGLKKPPWGVEKKGERKKPTKGGGQITQNLGVRTLAREGGGEKKWRAKQTRGKGEKRTHERTLVKKKRGKRVGHKTSTYGYRRGNFGTGAKKIQHGLQGKEVKGSTGLEGGKSVIKSTTKAVW